MTQTLKGNKDSFHLYFECEECNVLVIGPVDVKTITCHRCTKNMKVTGNITLTEKETDKTAEEETA